MSEAPDAPLPDGPADAALRAEGRAARWFALTGAVPTAALLALIGQWVWDDAELIRDHLAGMGLSEVLGLWTTPVGGGDVGGGYYRPLAMSLLVLVGHLGPAAGHVLSAAFHAGSTLLVHRLLRGRPGALAGTLAFSLHPLAAEVLGWISALPDALALFFGLASVWVARRGLLLSGILLWLGMMSKETAVLLLPAALVAGLVPPRALWAWAAAVGVALAQRGLAGVGASWSIAGKLGFVPLALCWPLSSMIVPWPLTAVRDLWVAPAWVLPVGLLVLAVALSLAMRDRLARGGLLLLVGGPLLALPPTLHGYLAAERYAYPSLVGLALIVASVRPRLPAIPRAAWPLLLLGPLLQLRAAAAWSSDERLFTAATEALPESGYAWHLRGMVSLIAAAPGPLVLGTAGGAAPRCDPAQSRGDWEDAASAFGRALETAHPHPMDRSLRLQSLVEACQFPEALALARAGPTAGLTAADVAWWARAAAGAGEAEEALRVVRALKVSGGWDGPPWVPELAFRLGVDR